MSSANNQRPSLPLRSALVGGLALLTTCSSTWAENATHRLPARMEKLFTLLDSIDPEVDNEIAITRLELASIKEADGWTAPMKENVTSLFERTIAPTPTSSTLYPTTQSRTLAIGMASAMGVMNRNMLPPPAGDFLKQIYSRFGSLGFLRLRVEADLATETIAAVDPVWTRAKTPADLQSIIPLLQRMKTAVFDKQPGSFPDTTGRFRQPSVGSAEMEAARGLSILLLPPEPLLLPEPEADPAKYLRTRLIWGWLGRWKLTALSLSEMRLKVGEYDSRLYRLANGMVRNLDQLILRHAPLAEIKKAADQLEIFRLPTKLPPGWAGPSPAASTPPGSPEVLRVTDYHELLGRTPGQIPDPRGRGLAQPPAPTFAFMPPVSVKTLDAYQSVLALLSAEATTPAPHLAPFQQAVRNQIYELNIDLRVFFEDQFNSPTTAAASPSASFTPDAKTPPVTALITALENIVNSETRNGLSANGAQTISPLWRSLNSPADTPFAGEELASSETASLAWPELAFSPDGPALIRLRDRAARDVLTKIGGPMKADPLPVLLREQLEKAIAAGDWPRCHRLLLLDQAAVVFAPFEHREWLVVVMLLQPPSSDVGYTPLTPSQRYREILALSSSPTVTAAAARQLKALPQKN